jgi:hypothetical protein
LCIDFRSTETNDQSQNESSNKIQIVHPEVIKMKRLSKLTEYKTTNYTHFWVKKELACITSKESPSFQKTN